MATTLIGRRPSALPAALLAVHSGATATNPGHVPGIGAGVIPTYVPPVGTIARSIDNSIGTPAVSPMTGAAAAGAAMSGRVETMTAALLSQRLVADKAKGFNARGNPPRGRRGV